MATTSWVHGLPKPVLLANLQAAGVEATDEESIEDLRRKFAALINLEPPTSTESEPSIQQSEEQEVLEPEQVVETALQQALSTYHDGDDEEDDIKELCYDVLSWEETARKEQQQYYLMFGDRDYNSFKPNERLFLVWQVGFALFGAPQEIPSNENRYTGYGEQPLVKLLEIVKKIEECQGSRYETLLAIIFVTLKIDGSPVVSVPVFRIPKFDKDTMADGAFFVDNNCRVYNDWANYLQYNKLPPCSYCYPWNGVYNGDGRDNVLVEFGISPAGKLASRVLSKADTASNAVALTAAGITIASLATPIAAGALAAATVGGVSAGLYGIGRSIGLLKDRYEHKQDIGLADAESRASWFSVVGGFLGVGSGAALHAVSTLAQEGVAIGAIGSAAVTTLNVASLVANGTGLVNNLYSLVERGAAGELTRLEVFQFSLSVFFFTHSIINFQTASSVIQESQRGVIKDFKKSLRSNRHRREFRRLTKDSTRGMDITDGNAKIIRAIKHIDNKDTFFAGMARGRKEFAMNKAKITLSEDGNIRINDKVSIHPLKFREMNKNQRQVILDSSKAFSRGKMSRGNFHHEVKNAIKQHKVQFSQARVDTKATLCSTFGVNNLNNIMLGGRRIFQNLENIYLDILSASCQSFGVEEMLQLSRTLAESVKCQDTKEFTTIIQFLHEMISKTLYEMEYTYKNTLNGIQKRDPGFNKHEFDIIYGIVDDRIKFSLTVIFNFYKLTHNINKLVEDYRHFINSKSFYETEDQFVLSGTLLMLRDFSVKGELCRNEILAIASKVLGTDVSKTSEIVHDANEYLVFSFCDGLPNGTVIIETNANEGTVVAKEL